MPRTEHSNDPLCACLRCTHARKKNYDEGWQERKQRGWKRSKYGKVATHAERQEFRRAKKDYLGEVNG